jgi:hypothetical protein
MSARRYNVAAMARMYSGGSTLAAVGEAFHCSAPTVWKVLRRLRPEIMRNGAFGVPGAVDEAAQMYADGCTLREVGARFGVSAQCIANTLRRKRPEMELRRPGPRVGSRYPIRGAAYGVAHVRRQRECDLQRLPQHYAEKGD